MSPTNTNTFPVLLEQVFFTRQSVISIPGYVRPDKPTAISIVPSNTISLVPVPDRPKVYAAIMQTIFNQEQNPNAPYFIDMECHAIFIGKEESPDEEIQRAVAITGHNVAFGAIREAVYWMTGRQPYGPMPLGLSILQPGSPSDTEKGK
ncbi:hypothetical protein [Acidithiobacillus caldus]|uniref:hypothetical protein n=1 Tax=Acidithiobacillus caldus TaxID=33059 RepID=UPI00114C93EF|nr:hypothetical protein [Acidithiobacillus caldus]